MVAVDGKECELTGLDHLVMPIIEGIEVSRKGVPVARTLLDLREKIGSKDKWIVAAVEEDGAIDFEILWRISPDVARALIQAGLRED